MIKRLLVIAALVVALAWLVGGCSLDKNHNRKVIKGFKYDVSEFHKDFDFYFLDYSADDPWRN